MRRRTHYRAALSKALPDLAELASGQVVAGPGYGILVLSAGQGMVIEGGPREGGLGAFEQLEEEQGECWAFGQQASTS